MDALYSSRRTTEYIRNKLGPRHALKKVSDFLSTLLYVSYEPDTSEAVSSIKIPRFAIARRSAVQINDQRFTYDSFDAAVSVDCWPLAVDR